jgi:hypothetical protein
VGCSFCVGLVATIGVLNDLWASRTFALGFLVRPFDGATGWVEGGVEDTFGRRTNHRRASLQRELAKRETRIL